MSAPARRARAPRAAAAAPAQRERAPPPRSPRSALRRPPDPSHEAFPDCPGPRGARGGRATWPRTRLRQPRLLPPAQSRSHLRCTYPASCKPLSCHPPSTRSHRPRAHTRRRPRRRLASQRLTRSAPTGSTAPRQTRWQRCDCVCAWMCERIAARCAGLKAGCADAANKQHSPKADALAEVCMDFASPHSQLLCACGCHVFQPPADCVQLSLSLFFVNQHTAYPLCTQHTAQY